MVVVVLLVARVPPLERAIGQDRLVAWHRRLGPWPLYLLLAHAVLITVGYARQAHTGLLHQFGQLLLTYPGILAAVAGSLALFAAGITSYRLARRRMAYETWWSVHLYTYLALFLSFSHQVDTGASFVGHPVARFWWTALWVGTLAVVVAARVLLPVWRSLRHRVRVVSVTPEGPGVVSVLLRGRRLDRLPVAGGQFFQWRFLRRGLWWQAHPYSLSAAPSARRAAHHGQGPRRPQRRARRAAARDARGDRGALRDLHRRQRRARPAAARRRGRRHRADPRPARRSSREQADVTVLLRGSTHADLVLRDEVADEVAHRGGRLLELVGSRDEVPLDAGALRRLVPDVRRREVYLCGPDALARQLAAELERAGVAESRIHFESFTF